MEHEKILKQIATKKGIALEDILNEFDELDMDTLYDEMLDECYRPIEICGLRYYPSDIFEKIDPVAYRCGFSDFVDSQEKDDRIISFDNGSTYYDLEQIEEFIDQHENEEE